MSSDDLTVSIKLRDLRQFLADTNKAEKGVDDVANKTRKQGAASRAAAQDTARHGSSFNSLRKLAIAAGAALITSFVGRGVASAVNAASDLNEEINKSQVVFRGSEKTMIKWSEGTAEALGISQRQALASAGIFGNMLVPMGYGRKEAGKMSRQFVGLAADMASFNNASPEDTLDALRAGLAGETEPLRRYGVFLNDARIKQEAMSKGLWNGKGQLTAYAKAQAITNLIMKDTKDAQGDVARTSDSLANTQRRLAAQWENIQAQIGQYLLPYIARFANWLSNLITEMQNGTGTGGQLASILKDIGKWIQRLWRFTQRVANLTKSWIDEYRDGNPIIVVATALIGGLVAGLIAMKVLKDIVTYIKATRTAMIGLNATMYASPFVWIPAIIIGVGVALYLLYTKVEWFRNGVNAVWNWIRNNWPLLLAILTGPIGAAVIFIIRHWDEVKSAATNTVNFVTGAWQTFVDFLKGLPGAVLDVGTAMGKSIANGMIDIINAAIQAINSSLSFSVDVGVGPVSKTFSVDPPDIPKIAHLATGGTALSAGTVMVGENGPEIMHMPAGASVLPLTGPKVNSVMDSIGDALTIEIHTHVELDGREVGRSVDRYNSDRAARL